MKLTTALGIFLTTTSSNHHVSAFFVPSTRPVLRNLHRSPPSASSTARMIGGGMIERPPGEAEDPATGADGDADAEGSPADLTEADVSELFQREVDAFSDRLGYKVDVDPWDPNPYIKPRPGKYGWEDTRGLFRTVTLSDEDLASAGQVLADEERDENLKLIRALRNDDIPLLVRSGDELSTGEAVQRADELEAKDPWYNLNFRLGEAVRFETEDVDSLRSVIEKVGGPPPLLVSKAAEADSGHVSVADVLSAPPDNARLESILKRRGGTDGSTDLDESRREMVKAEIARLDNPSTAETERAEIEELQRARTEAYWLSQAQSEVETTGVRKDVVEKVTEEKKQRAELLKMYGATETGEDELFYGNTEREAFVDDTMKEFAEDVRRMNGLFALDDVDAPAIAGTDDGFAAVVDEEAGKPLTKAGQARAEAMKNDGSGRPRLPGDPDVTRGELDAGAVVNESSAATTGPLTVEVSSRYNTENSDPPMRKHCFQYTVRIANGSAATVQLLSRRFEIQTVGSSMKDVVQGEGVTGRQPVLGPGEAFEYTSTAPLSVRPIGTTEVAARMSGEYRYVVLEAGQEIATEEQVNGGRGEAGAELATFHFVFPEEQRVKPVRPSDDDDDEEEEDDGAVKTSVVASATKSSAPPAATDAAKTATATAPASSLPGEPDMTSGNVAASPPNDASDTLTSDVRVAVTSTYRPERSDADLDKHCFAYNVRITNESGAKQQAIQLVSRRFEIQTVGSASKDVVQGPGVTGRQPVLGPGESFEYTSTAPLSVRPMLDRTRVVARMSGEYNFVRLAADGKTPLSSTPLKAELGSFHFILPE